MHALALSSAPPRALCARARQNKKQNPWAFVFRARCLGTERTMDFFLGIRGARHGFVMLCCDTAATQQIITIKHDEDKLLALDDRTVMALSGE